MFRLLKRIWLYLTAAGNSKFNELADPKVQIEQAIQEAQERHRTLKDQAATVIANSKQTEMRLNRSMSELEKVRNNVETAILQAEEANQAGNTTEAAQYTDAAQAFSERLIALEAEVEDLKNQHLATVHAAEQASAAVQTNASNLQKQMAERAKLLSQLDQAKMQETMNKAMDSLTATVGQDVPTLNEVRDKIEKRYAKALGTAQLQGESVEGKMLEIEQKARSNDAVARLEQIKAQLGVGAAKPVDVETAKTAEVEA